MCRFKGFWRLTKLSDNPFNTVIDRPLGLPEDQGCLLSVDNGNNFIDVRDSLSLPINVIDSGKVTHLV